MSLKEASRIYKACKRAGMKVHVAESKASCDLHRPGRHPMCGNYVVVELFLDGAGEAARCIWEKPAA